MSIEGGTNLGSTLSVCSSRQVGSRISIHGAAVLNDSM
jgi:hypothetical protein